MPKLSGDNEVEFSEAEVALYKAAYGIHDDQLLGIKYWFEYDIDTSMVLDTNMPEREWRVGYILASDGFRYLCMEDGDTPPDYFVDYEQADDHETIRH